MADFNSRHSGPQDAKCIPVLMHNLFLANMSLTPYLISIRAVDVLRAEWGETSVLFGPET